jgi:hypothetical protein
MISFKQFLSEAEVTPMSPAQHEGDLEKLAEIVKSSGYHMNGEPYLWRGVRGDFQAGLVHPGSGKRESQNTTNFYTVAFDTNPANAAWPKRSKSFIATTNERVAKGYGSGNVLGLYPLFDTELGVVDKPDFWRARLKFPRCGFLESTVAMNTVLSHLIQSKDVPDSLDALVAKCKSMPAQQFKETLLDELVVGSAVHTATPEAARDMFADDLRDAYVYKNCGMILTDNPEKLPPNTEVWFSGKCVAIPADQLEEFMAFFD